MKKLLSLLLCLVLLAGLLISFAGLAGRPGAAETPAPTVTAASEATPAVAPEALPAGTSAPASPSPTIRPLKTPEAETPAGFLDEVDAQVFAATMACWLNGYEAGDELRDPLLLWDMAGWYAARCWRTEGYDLLSREQVEGFLRAMGEDAPGEAPESWLDGVVKRVRSSDGQELYDFQQHKTFIENMLGVDTEVLTSEGEGLSVESVVVVHHPNGETENRRYNIRFEENPDTDSAFAYRLAAAEPWGPLLSGPLSFDLELLLEANSLTNIFSMYPAVNYRCLEYGADYHTWLIPRGEELARLELSAFSCNGSYRGCSFDYQEWPDGKKRAMVGQLGTEQTRIADQDDLLQHCFDGLLEMRFDYIDNDLIWTDCRFEGGLRAWIAVDRGTLVLRESRFRYGEDSDLVTTIYDYKSPPPELPFLDSWDRPLRTLILHWENFEGSELKTWTETVRVPRDWEYLPYEGRWGNYTVYLDEGYTKPYVYPGDGPGYTLYLTTAKG